MDLYPAIDLRGGRCVRLVQGDFDRETVYGDDRCSVARRFATAGARWIHVVDLDAARAGEPVNRRGHRRAGGVVAGPAPDRRRCARRRAALCSTPGWRGSCSAPPGGRGPGLVPGLAPRTRAGWPSASTIATARCGAGLGRRLGYERSLDVLAQLDGRAGSPR